MSQRQVSLAAIFVLTAAVALANVLLQNLGMFWMLMIGGVFVLLHGPAWESVNPLLLAIGYTTIALVFTLGLAYCMNVSPYQALVPCFAMPAFAYIVGFLKGMENA